MAEAKLKTTSPPPTAEVGMSGGEVPYLSNLYTLSYIRQNAVRTTMLYFKEGTPLNEVVDSAKKLCKSKSWNFSWIEPSIVFMEDAIVDSQQT